VAAGGGDYRVGVSALGELTRHEPPGPAQRRGAVSRAAVRSMPAGLPDASRIWAWRIIILASLAMLLLLTDGRPWTLFASGSFSSDFYDAQAESLTHGRLAVDPSVASIEGIVQGDETHIYYGLFLALVRVPFALVTDELSGQITRASMLVAYILALVLTVHLAHASQQLVGREVDDAADHRRIAVLLLAVATSPILFLFGWITVYHETELWAVTLALAALVCAVRLVTTPEPRWAYGAAVASSLCTLTRAPVGVAVTGASLVALVVAYRLTARHLVGPALAALSGVVIHVAVNMARFGGPFDLPFSEQLLTRVEPARARWVEAHGNSFFGLEFVPSNLLHYLRPDALRFERMAPFVRFGPPATELNGIEFESNTPATSLTLSATLLVVLAVVGVAWAVRRRRFALVAMIAATTVAGVPTLAFGFVANRYPIDFLPALALAAAVAVWLEPPARLPVRGLVLGLVVWGTVVNVSLGVWWSHAADPGFIEGRFRLDERLFDGASPGVTRVADVTDRAMFGTVAVDADDDRCHGVYVVGYKGWTVVERTPGDRVIEGFAARGDERLVDTGVWTLDLTADGRVVYSADGTDRVLATVDAAAGTGLLEYTIVADPVTDESYGVVGSTFFYLPVQVLDGPPLGTRSGDPGRLCRLMTERLGSDRQG
jgi:hypothetical protein